MVRFLSIGLACEVQYGKEPVDDVEAVDCFVDVFGPKRVGRWPSCGEITDIVKGEAHQERNQAVEESTRQSCEGCEEGKSKGSKEDCQGK